MVVDTKGTVGQSECKSQSEIIVEVPSRMDILSILLRANKSSANVTYVSKQTVDY